MSFGNYAGTAIIPALSRIVLGIAFITAGYNKVFNKVEFVGDDAARLINLEVISAPPVAAGASDLVVRPASFIQDADAGQDAEQTGKDATDAETGSTVDEALDKAADRVQDTAEKVTESIDEAARDIADKLPDDAGASGADEPEIDVEIPIEGAAGEARAMHHVTLMLDRAGWPQPVWQARLAAFTELIGGALLLVGLFSRIWALGLSVAMAVAFYLTSLEPYFSTGLFTAAQGADGYALFNRVFVQASLFVLAFGVFLTGPGPLSLDRLFFGRRSAKDEASAEPSFE